MDFKKKIELQSKVISGDFFFHKNEYFYKIKNVDQMPHFFTSVVSDSDHWLFVSSNGGVTAGRISPESALFPYIPVDKIYESNLHTGSKTLLKVAVNNSILSWEPFNDEHSDKFSINRNLYKNFLGDKLCFEEVNHDLKLVFRYTWMTSDEYGFIRDCELESFSDETIEIQMVDGLQNILPANTPRALQNTSSNLIDAYKWNELDEASGLAFFALYSGITDKPEPCESLYANTAFQLGFDDCEVLLSLQQLAAFRNGQAVSQESCIRGRRGAYLINTKFSLATKSVRKWQFVANVNQTQKQVIDLIKFLLDKEDKEKLIQLSVQYGSEELERIMGSMDGLQSTAEDAVSLHHYANVLFNGMRGGIFDDQYNIDIQDFLLTLNYFNQKTYQEYSGIFSDLPDKVNFQDLLNLIEKQKDKNLERLFYEYLPLTFGRRHGDPSRPWNQFAIKLKNSQGERLLSYQGNWRDIFQNWEALLFSYPGFIENTIAKFVNASTVDGYNPYRITKEGIDWEVEDPEDPWSYIGYWGDHQIIYLLKLLELSSNFHSEKLSELLRRPLFCYANVPYRIKSFNALLEDPKNTIIFDHDLAEKINRRVAEMGVDGKLLLDSAGGVYQVNLLEKLLVPLLSKLSNLVLAGGIWMNTQRPEWNDANNALVGYGLSMVTLYYLRRYIHFLQNLLKNESEPFLLSTEVSTWLLSTTATLKETREVILNHGAVDSAQCFETLENLGQAASDYRQAVYSQESFSGKVSQDMGAVQALLTDALAAIDYSIAANQREDGLYHAYNLLDIKDNQLEVNHLYTMLEGQVAALSSGAIEPKEAVQLLEALFETPLYRPDQQTFMLYPDRQLPGFLEKNRIPRAKVMSIPLLEKILKQGDECILFADAHGDYRFNAELINKAVLDTKLDEWHNIYGETVESLRGPLHDLYETVFKHKAFTGRSGTMFGFEGLGCIYWHMVSKLLLATQEVFFLALQQGAAEMTCHQLAGLYYRVRQGIGFNKTPAEYGAFPTDPYSHTPKHAGAQQPGMTGQVKEEILTRFGELGVRVESGKVRFQPKLLRACEFVSKTKPFYYYDVFNQRQELTVPEQGLAFTWCQVPIIYVLDENKTSLVIHWKDKGEEVLDSLELSEWFSQEIFMRTGRIEKLTLTFSRSVLFNADFS